MKRESAEHVEIEIRAGDDDQPEAGEQRYNDPEGAMLGLVAKNLHAQPCADTAAYDSQQQEISLRQAGTFSWRAFSLAKSLSKP